MTDFIVKIVIDDISMKFVFFFSVRETVNNMLGFKILQIN